MRTTTEHYIKLAEILGKEFFLTDVESPFDFVQLATKGISAKIIKNFRSYFNISRNVAADMLNISEPTLYRWIKADKILDKNYSVQLFELTDLFLYGIEVFKNQDNFFKWLKLPNTALGGLEPQILLELPGGVSKVRDILGRIEHGVYS